MTEYERELLRLLREIAEQTARNRPPKSMWDRIKADWKQAANQRCY